MEIQTKSELSERAFFLYENIKRCFSNIRDNYLEAGLYCNELKRGKMYKLLMPEAKNWAHFVSVQDWGLGVAQLDNYGRAARLLGDVIESKDVPLNRAIDITRIVNKLPAGEVDKTIEELVESAATLPKSGWDDVCRIADGKTPSDVCMHEETEMWEKCCVKGGCGKWLRKL